MSVNVRDMLTETADLDGAEKGCHFTLLFALWDAGGGLPFDDERLARRGGVSISQWPHVWKAIERHYEVVDGVLTSPMVSAEIKRVRTTQRARRRGAEVANGNRRAAEMVIASDEGAQRPLSDRSATVQRPPSDRSATANHTQTNTQTQDPDRIADSSAIVADDNAEPPVLTFPCAGGVRAWSLTKDQVSEWQALFPALDVEQECRGALAWVRSNQKKTAGGMKKFLVSWFSRSQNRPPSKAIVRQIRDQADVTHDAAARFLDRHGGNAS